MRRVEFSGIPGSGKSTILPIVARYLRQQGQDVVDQQNLIHRTHGFPFNSSCFRGLIRTIPPKLRQRCTRGLNHYFYVNYEYQLKYMASHLAMLQHVTGCLEARPIPPSHKQMLLRWFIKMAGAYQMACECLSEDAVFLCDEGYVQKVISFYVSVDEDVPDPAEMERYLDQIPDGLTLIHVSADLETCRRRIVERRLPRRLTGCGDEEITSYLVKSKEAIEFAARHVARQGGQVIVVNNSTEPFAAAQIEQQLSRSPIRTGRDGCGSHALRRGSSAMASDRFS